MTAHDIFTFTESYKNNPNKWEQLQDHELFFKVHNNKSCLWVAAERIRNLIEKLNSLFINRKDVIDLLIFSIISDVHIVLLGDPGTGKTLLIRKLCELMGLNTERDFFDFLLTPTTTPVQLFGPPDIKELENGRLKYNTDKYLPDKMVVFLDEIFKVNSAIANSLLSILNEGIFFNGNYGPQKVKMFMFFSAANQIPVDPELDAFKDRLSMIVETEEIGMDLDSEEVKESNIELLKRGYLLQNPVKTASCLNDFLLFNKFLNMVPDDLLLGEKNNTKVARLYNELLYIAYNQWAQNLSDRNKVKLWKVIKSALYFDIAESISNMNYNINQYFTIIKKKQDTITHHLAIILNSFLNRVRRKSRINIGQLEQEISQCFEDIK